MGSKTDVFRWQSACFYASLSLRSQLSQGLFMFISTMAAVAAFALPNVGLEDARFMLERLPARYTWEEKWTSADLKVLVNPEGRILECAVMQLSGSEEVAKRMCDIFKGRKIKRARTFQGHPAYGLTVFRTGFHASPSQPPPDLGPKYSEKLVISVDRLPSSDAGELISSLPIGLSIGPRGEVEACQSLEESSESAAAIGCRQAVDRRFDILRDAQGSPVQYVRQIEVNFEIAAAQPSDKGSR